MRLNLILCLLLVVSIAGCTSPSRTASRPAGFTLAVTVHPPEDNAAADQPRAYRPARYVIESDLVFRTATGPVLNRPGAEYPPQLRRLSPWQMDQLWLKVEEAQLLDAHHPGRHPPPVPTVVDAAHSVAVFEVTRRAQPHIVVVTLDDVSPHALSAADVLDFLAQLAWIPDEPQ